MLWIDPDDWHDGDGTAPLVYFIYVSKRAYCYTTILKEFWLWDTDNRQAIPNL